jgi:hypothetical protein
MERLSSFRHFYYGTIHDQFDSSNMFELNSDDLEIAPDNGSCNDQLSHSSADPKQNSAARSLDYD